MAEITTLEWPEVVSEVSFPTFGGVIVIFKVASVFRFGDHKLAVRGVPLTPGPSRTRFSRKVSGKS